MEKVHEKRDLFFAFLLLSILQIQYVEAKTSPPTNNTYEPNWPSLNSRPLPSWYDQAKFGIFIHWGVYSVPSWGPTNSYAEWYWYQLAQGPGNPTYEFHIKTYGVNFPYQNFAPLFQAELFNVTQWVDLFVQSGAKYVVPTSKHHEGYTLWPSAESWNWNAMDVGPEQDLLGMLLNATRAAGLRAGLYYSLYEWFNPLYIGTDPHVYVDEVMLPQLYDVVKRYQPEIVWADGEWQHSSSFWNTTDFLAWLYTDSPVANTVVVNDRWGNETRGVDGGFYTAEYNTSAYWLGHKWEENSGIDTYSYGLNRNSQLNNYFTAQQLVQLLIRTVAYGGNLLLDVGPRSDGTIIPLEQERLLEIGGWLSVNGEAIYSTSPWRVQNESSLVFYTQNTGLGAVYAISYEWPSPGTPLVLEAPFPSSEVSVSILGLSNDFPVRFNYTVGQPGLSIFFPVITPATNPCSYAWTLKLQNVS